MTSWAWLLFAVGAFILLYAGFVAWLVVVGRREEARALAGFIPDCAVLTGRLLRDPRVPRRHKLMLAGLLGYLAFPFDLVPDFIPVVGQLDDVLVTALVLRAFLRSGGEGPAREHWPGPQRSLDLVLRLGANGMRS
ncbi:MAG TPA: YkvA family protein [Gaiellaceae bacterium]